MSQPIDVADVSTARLLQLYAGVLDELLRRGVIRTRNAPAGDLAERLVQIAYDGDLAPPSAKSWDVCAADGRLLQVKCRVVQPGSRSQSFSPFRSWDFSCCVFVLLDARSYQVTTAKEVETAVFRPVAKKVPWVGGERIGVGQLTGLAGKDVTDRIRAALDSLG